MLKCRACSKVLGAPFLSLGNSPLSNSYLSKIEINQMEPYYPLDVYVCSFCFLVQIEEFETAKNIFTSDYAYLSSFSDSWLKHCEEFTAMVIDRFQFDSKSFILEIGSNDGSLLQFFKQRQIPILGIDPASTSVAAAQKKNIPTNIAYFNTSYARSMKKNHKQADLIIGNNVLAHNPHLNDFIEGLKILLKPAGVITMEFPHVLKLIEGNQFDTIYHEHFFYFSFFSIQKTFASHGLTIFDVEEISTHGGSLRIYGVHENNQSETITNRVKNLLKKEHIAGLFHLKTYDSFKSNVESTKRNLLKSLIQLKDNGKEIVGYGAPAKGNTLLNYCGIRNDFLNYTVDLNPYKQNKFLPGTHISIKHPGKIAEDKPDYILILPWNIKDEVIKQMSFIRKWDGKFIIPIPTVEIF